MSNWHAISIQRDFRYTLFNTTIILIMINMHSSEIFDFCALYYYYYYYYYFIAELNCEEVADFLLVQSKFEEITLKNKMDCTYARNPFSDEQPKMATNEDVLRGTSVRPSFMSGTDEFIINFVWRDIPHGSGSLKTPSGEPLYSGDWCEGTANLII